MAQPVNGPIRIQALCHFQRLTMYTEQWGT
jgi:hypothetical protein